MQQLSHLDANGKARMVDVSGKPPQRRTAEARGLLRLSTATRQLIRQRKLAKGDVFTVAQLAGIMGAKRTAELIPLCHPLPLDQVSVTLKLTRTGVEAVSQAICTGRTGVEMEALTAVSVALLTVYDMCKAVDSAMCMEDIRLVSKEKQDV